MPVSIKPPLKMGPTGSGSDDSKHSDQRPTTTKFVNQLLQHDLRNHLLVIQGNVELLLEEIHNDDAVEHLQTVKSQTDSAFSLLEETMAMMNGARGAASAFKPVASSVEAELGHIEAAYPEANITVDSSGQLTERAPPFSGSIVSNLLRNAIVHTEQHSPRVRLHVAVNEGIITLVVEDEGPGIPDEILENIGTRENDGMGLYIVHSLVQEYGGTLAFETDSNGTTVTVRLPTTLEGEEGEVERGTKVSQESQSVQHPIAPGESISTAVVRAVAAISDTQIENLDPLASVIDPDALESIFNNSESGRVEFQYEGHTVTVEPDRVWVKPSTSL
jgi:two-component sensor histidine kinase